VPFELPKRLLALLVIFILLPSGSFVVGCSGDEPTGASFATEPASAPTSSAESGAIAPVMNVAAESQGNAADYWWNDSVFYQVFVRSFFDSDGDGIGDLQGVIEKLDYLNDGDPATDQDLGIGGIWLMPIAESASYHGYDVVDYYAIESDYGAEGDLNRLVTEAHERGIQVIVDLVINHTSSQHPWFVSARKGDGEPYRQYYIWSDEDPGYRSPWGSRVWHRSGNYYYYGIFWEGMPDLNHQNPEVNDEIAKVARHWLEDMGVDGFRLDGVKHLIEDGRVQEHTAATHEWLKQFRKLYKEIKPNALAVGEVWSPTRDVVAYVGDELDLAFEFDTAEAMLNSAKYENRSPVQRALRLVVEQYPPSQFATFLTNHDMNRVMSQLDGNEDHAKTAASLLLTGPGVPFIYYGEEIGQAGAKPDENIRTPMQWTDQNNAGFTAASSAWRAPQPDYRQVNVANQMGDSESLLNHYRRMIQIRNEHAALRVGGWRDVDVTDGRVYAFIRSTETETLLVVINLGGEPVSDYALNQEQGSPAYDKAHEIMNDVAVDPPVVDADGGFDGYHPIGTLAPYETYIVRLD
jgi:alpha-amylase